jgi:tetratricopeptide (TPR) repeat protein
MMKHLTLLQKTYATLLLLMGIVATSSSFANDAKEEVKGLLPEISSTNESADEIDKKSMASELLISRSEEKATETLLKIIKKNKGAPHEPELHNRLAELHMRRSKSGRFFDLNRENASAQKALQLFPVPLKSGKEYVKKAIQVYDHILANFKTYQYTDTVLFENAFAYNQVSNTKKSLELYQTLIKSYPQSRYLPESIMAMGEIYYNEGKFKECLTEISKLDQYKDSRVYLYGMYKAAWAHYNLKNSTDSVEKLLIVANANSNVYSLRKEALKDLILFTSDFYQASQMYPFLKKHATADELVWIVSDLAQIYQSYSRYLDANMIIDSYQKDFPLSVNSVKLEMSLADNFEWLKKRSDVLKHLEMAQKHCQPKSEWATSNTQETYQQSCNIQLKSFQAEMIKKWWEIWEKNKLHKEFNELLIGLLRVAILNEDLAETDKKARFLLAEILFHNQNFEESSNQYQLVGDKSQDQQLRHDSYYSALYSFEKYIESSQFKNQISKKDVQDRIYVLSQQYLTFSPQGVHNQQVRLKLATVATEKKDYQQALNYLAEIREVDHQNKDLDFSIKCEDLQLEIFNIQKNYKELQEYAGILAAKSKDALRKKRLIQISQEAEFNQIIGSKENEKLLLAFSEKNIDLKLGQEALWKVISENYKNKKMMTAATLSEVYAKRYPSDERAQSALTEALGFYVSHGYFVKAISVSSLIKSETNRKDFAEKMGDYLRLEAKYLEASEKYLPLLEQVKPDSEEFLRLFEKIKFLSDKDPQVRLDKIYDRLIQKGIEPYLSRHQIKKANDLLLSGRDTEVFDIARKIMAKPITSEEKFGARMLQAQVLEKEFVSQSLKTSPSKLSLILAIKTEKFDKAYTSFNDALQMTQDPEKQKLALLGIQRTFDHFSSSMENIPLSDELSDQEKAAVKSELSKLVQPLVVRRKENEEKIAQVSGLKDSKSKDMAQALSLYLDSGRALNWPLILAKGSAISDLEEITEKTNYKLDQITINLDNFELKNLNLYHLALLALQEKKLQKSQYLLAQLESLNAKKPNPYIQYLQAYIYQKDNKFDLAYKNFSIALGQFEDVKVFNKISQLEEFIFLKAIKSYALKDYLTVLETYPKLKKYKANNIKLTQIYVDSLIETGQTEKAIHYLQSAVKQEKTASVVEYLKERLLALQKNGRQVSSETNK